MSKLRTVRLRTAKDPRWSLKLDYRYSPAGLTQSRFSGRDVLAPVISLGDYSCRAVIDFVSVSFELARSTQFRYVQSTLLPLTGRPVLVEPSLPDPGGVATTFTVRFQEPHFAFLRQCHELLMAEFGVVSEPFVNEVEVSVDFTPNIHSDEDRARMVAVLARHLYPSRSLFSKSTTRPRFSWGPKPRQNSYTLRPSKRRLHDADVLLNTAGDESPPIDATYYIGHRKVGPLWRVMDKVIDRQNRAAGTWIDLSEEDKRARVEVRLDQLELKRLGVKSLDDLLTFNFAALQGPYFKFMLPTFIAPSPTIDAADRHWERVRLQRFLNVGVVGLRAMDEQRAKERGKHRRALIGHLRTMGVPAPARDRTGRGQSGTFIAYALLNDRVSMALRKLVERERREVGVIRSTL